VPANIDPIYSKAPDIQWTTIPASTTANTSMDGTGTVFTVFTADATNGGFVQNIRIKSPGVSAQTAIRFFINNGSTNATAANNTLIDEVTLQTFTAVNNAAAPVIDVPIGRALSAGYKINCCYGVSNTSAAVYLTAFGGKF